MMARRKLGSSETETIDDYPYYFVPVTDELRKRADDLSIFFDDLLSSKESIIRNGVEVKKKISWRKELVLLKVREETVDAALIGLARLGTLRNKLFPSSPLEYYDRCLQRDNVRRVKAAGASLSKILCNTELRPLPLDDPLSLSPGGRYSREYQMNELLERAKENPHSVTVADLNRVLSPGSVDVTPSDVIEQKYGHDPLEQPASLRRVGDTRSEVLIFLEHYLPSGLVGVVRDLSRKSQTACRVDALNMKLVHEFYRCFCAFHIDQISLVQSNRELSALIDEIHTKLFQVVEVVRQTALVELPHEVVIFEQGNELEFSVDGKPVLLTTIQREALVVLALLGNKRAFTVEEFSRLAPTRKSSPGRNFDNKVVLLRAVLPRLKSKRQAQGYRTIENIIFIDVPSDKRLHQSLDGALGSKE